MTVRRATGLQFALVKEILDVNAQKLQVEGKIRAAEQRTRLLLENAAQRDIDAYQESNMHSPPRLNPVCP